LFNLKKKVPNVPKIPSLKKVLIRNDTNKTEKSFSNIAASQFCFSRSNKSTTTLQLHGCVIVVSQGCVIVVSQGCMIVVSQGCIIVALQGSVIVVLQDCVIVSLQGCVIVVSQGCVIVALFLRYNVALQCCVIVVLHNANTENQRHLVAIHRTGLKMEHHPQQQSDH
jgi:hypothetical protein